MNLFDKKNKRHIVMFDIRTSSIGAFAFKKESGKLPEVLAFSKIPLRLLDAPGSSSMENSVLKTFEDTSKALTSSFKDVIPDMIFVVLSSPWFQSQTRSVKISRESPFIVTQKFLDDIIRDETDLFIKRSEETFSSRADQLEVLECAIMKITLNGYRVTEPIKKNAREMTMSLYLSASRREFIELIRESLIHNFGPVKIELKSEPLALFQILKDMIDCEEGFLTIDVGGEMTEVSLVRNCVIEGVGTFNKGGNFIIRRVASSLSTGLEEALSFIKSKSRGDLKEDIDQKISKILEIAGNEWRDGLVEALKIIGKSNTLPQNLVLTGGASGIEMLKQKSQSAELTPLTILGKPFNVIVFMPQDLESRINPGALDKKDTQLTLPLLLATDLIKNV